MRQMPVSLRDGTTTSRKPAAKTVQRTEAALGQGASIRKPASHAGLVRQELMMRGRLGSFIHSLGARSLRKGRRRGPADQDVRIEAGMAFARIISGNVTETAQVSEVIADGSGIPHIRFSVQVRDQNGLYNEGTRVLSRTSFLNTYHRLR